MDEQNLHFVGVSAGGSELRLFPENYLIAHRNNIALRWDYDFDLGIPVHIAVALFVVSMSYSGRYDQAEVVARTMNIALEKLERAKEVFQDITAIVKKDEG